jgi:hypothetical protein
MPLTISSKCLYIVFIQTFRMEPGYIFVAELNSYFGANDDPFKPQKTNV